MRKKTIIDSVHASDISALLKLAESVGWFFSPDRVNMYVSAGTMFGHRAGNRLISSAALFTYGTALASIGIVIVHPFYQGQGLGKSIMQRCLRETERMKIPISLVATSAGFPLYKSLGFQTVGSIHRYVYTNLAKRELETEHCGISELREEDLASVMNFDQIAFGADRSRLYPHLFKNRKTGFIIKEQGNVIRGFGIAFQIRETLHIGPLIADDIYIALQLMQKFISYKPKTVRIDIPHEQILFMKQLQTLGFKETLVSPLMLINADVLPGQRKRLFGIADPALG